MSLQACVLGTIDCCLSQQSSEKLMYSYGSSRILSASLFVNLIKLKQTWTTMFFISWMKGSWNLRSPEVILNVSIS